MKKKIIALIVLIMACTSLTACNFSGIINSFGGGSYNNVSYYGCPNSKRVKRLNLKKNKMK